MQSTSLLFGPAWLAGWRAPRLLGGERLAILHIPHHIDWLLGRAMPAAAAAAAAAAAEGGGLSAFVSFSSQCT